MFEILCLLLECRRISCDQRFAVHGRYGYKKNGAAETENGLRDQPQRFENNTEHIGVFGNHTAQA